MCSDAHSITLSCKYFYSQITSCSTTEGELTNQRTNERWGICNYKQEGRIELFMTNEIRQYSLTVGRYMKEL